MALIAISLAMARHQFTLRGHGCRASVSRGKPGSYCLYPPRVGQAELTSVTDYITGLFIHTLVVIRLSINWAHCRSTVLIGHSVLSIRPCHSIFQRTVKNLLYQQ